MSRSRPINPDYRPGPIDEDWQRTISQWRSTLFTDSPQGRSLYAAGAGFVMLRLQADFTKAEWNLLYDEIKAFAEAYMAESAP